MSDNEYYVNKYVNKRVQAQKQPALINKNAT
jgi:hypothetical protein